MAMAGEHVLICVAWPYANGPLHLGHVAGCYLPPDIQFRFERALGNKVLMVSGSDEHGTPITVTAETQGVSPQQVVDEYHAVNLKALLDLGCSWFMNLDRGGQILAVLCSIEPVMTSIERWFKRISRPWNPVDFFERKTMEQYYELRDDGSGRFLPDRYVEGTCRRAAKRVRVEINAMLVGLRMKQ